MKKIITSLIVMATITFTAQSQIRRNNSNGIQDSAQNKSDAQNENRKYHSKKDHKQMAEKLQFTDDQQQQMKSNNMDFKKKMQALKNSNLTTEEFNAKKMALQHERKQKTMALLTPEQKDKLKEYKKEQHGKGKMNSAKEWKKCGRN